MAERIAGLDGEAALPGEMAGAADRDRDSPVRKTGDGAEHTAGEGAAGDAAEAARPPCLDHSFGMVQRHARRDPRAGRGTVDLRFREDAEVEALIVRLSLVGDDRAVEEAEIGLARVRDPQAGAQMIGQGCRRIGQRRDRRGERAYLGRLGLGNIGDLPQRGISGRQHSGRAGAANRFLQLN